MILTIRSVYFSGVGPVLEQLGLFFPFNDKVYLKPFHFKKEFQELKEGTII